MFYGRVLHKIRRQAIKNYLICKDEERHGCDMKTKSVPAIIMLSAGFIACIAGMSAHMEVADFMKMLLIVLILFYVLGCVVKIIIEKNFNEMLDEETTEGEETEKEASLEGEEEAVSADEEK